MKYKTIEWLIIPLGLLVLKKMLDRKPVRAAAAAKQPYTQRKET